MQNRVGTKKIRPFERLCDTDSVSRAAPTLLLLRRRRVGAALPSLMLLMAVSQPIAAQTREREIAAPPVEAALLTKDGVELKATFFPSGAGRNATTVILLHDFNESRAMYRGLALALQQPSSPHLPPMESRAVITVDLRGHGQSKTAYGAGGQAVEIDASRFRPADYEDMVIFDMEAVRSFLVDQNDAGQLNLNKLCVAGVGMGANVGLIWAEKDWRTPLLPTRKQGQDVQALILISPRWNYDGLSVIRPLKYPPIQRDLSVFLAYGKEDPKTAEDGKRIYELLEKFRPEIPIDELRQKQDLFEYALPTQLQGAQLVQRPSFGLADRINGFIDARVDKQPFRYFKRK